MIPDSELFNQSAFLHKKTAAVYIALMPTGTGKSSWATPWKCIQISSSNKWSYEKVALSWFTEKNFDTIDIQEEFDRLPKFQEKIMRAVFGNYKGWQ